MANPASLAARWQIMAGQGGAGTNKCVRLSMLVTAPISNETPRSRTRLARFIQHGFETAAEQRVESAVLGGVGDAAVGV
jgi:hypothetical protein